jgi:GNAT superfamily N-acetyltransferase
MRYPDPNLRNKRGMGSPHRDVTLTPVRSPADIQQVADLAQQIWTEHYLPIIGQAQVQYMLGNLQSTAAITTQLGQGHEYFLVTAPAQSPGLDHCVARAYMDIVCQPETSKLFLSKLYVVAEARGTGIGRKMFDHALKIALQRKLTTLWLTVNKFNPSLHLYLHWGMLNKGSVVKEIGGGFVMDDFVLEMSVPN